MLKLVTAFNWNGYIQVSKWNYIKNKFVNISKLFHGFSCANTKLFNAYIYIMCNERPYHLSLDNIPSKVWLNTNCYMVNLNLVHPRASHATHNKQCVGTWRPRSQNLHAKSVLMLHFESGDGWCAIAIWQSGRPSFPLRWERFPIAVSYPRNASYSAQNGALLFRKIGRIYICIYALDCLRTYMSLLHVVRPIQHDAIDKAFCDDSL